MSEFVELITAFPAVVFTALLAFCLAWWLVATVAGIGDGVDSEPDADGALDDIGDTLGISAVPPAIGLAVHQLSSAGSCRSPSPPPSAPPTSSGGRARSTRVSSHSFSPSPFAVSRRSAARPASHAPVRHRAGPVRAGGDRRLRPGALHPEVDDDDTGSPGEIVVTSHPATTAPRSGPRPAPGRRYPSGAAVHIIDADHLDGRLVVTVNDVPHDRALASPATNSSKKERSLLWMSSSSSVRRAGRGVPCGRGSASS